MKFKAWINRLMVRLGISRAKKRSEVLKKLIDDPENFKIEAYIEDDELIIRVREKRIES